MNDTILADKWIEIWTAYKKGKTIQYKSGDNTWNDVDTNPNVFRIEILRVKPEPRTIWVNEYNRIEKFGNSHTTRSEAIKNRGILAIGEPIEFVEVIP